MATPTTGVRTREAITHCLIGEQPQRAAGAAPAASNPNSVRPLRRPGGVPPPRPHPAAAHPIASTVARTGRPS